jgi:predicted transcriptional regulator of viral defense system
MSKKTSKNSRSRDSSGERFARLAALGEQVVHTGDLANLWNIRNVSTLHMTLARYVTQGLLFRIQKGLYSIKNPRDVHPHILGLKAVHGPAYISCETVLFEAGVVNQPSRVMTLVSGKSRRFTLAGHEYWSRQLKDAFLYNDAGVHSKNGVRIADCSRAVADMLYYNPKKHFDTPSAIDWSAVRNIVRTVGYPASLLHHVHTK